MVQQHRSSALILALLILFVHNLFGNFSHCCRAFLFAGIKRRHTHRRSLPSISNPKNLKETSFVATINKMAISLGETENEKGSAENGSAVDFDLDQWQAGGITSFSQTCFAEYWSTLPSIITSDDTEGISDNLADPYDFSHRMALGKYLIEHTGGEEIWGSAGDGYCFKHWVWGYLAQLDWQHRSGRFEDPSKWQDTVLDGSSVNYGNEISKKSWWGYVNLNFSFAAYCGAAEAGLVPTISLSDESLKDDVCFQTCVKLWKDFWKNDHAAFLASCSANKEKDDDDDEQSTLTLYRALWLTHTDIIKTSLKYSKELQDILPKEDRGVGLGWCNMVELLSSTNWPLLSLDALYKFGAGYLPTMRLVGPRTVQWMKENRSLEYTTINSLYQLMDTSENTMGRACRFFARVSRWRFARNKLPRTLHVLTHGNPIQKCLALTRVVVLALSPRSLLEVGATVLALSILTMGKIGKTKKLLLN